MLVGLVKALVTKFGEGKLSERHFQRLVSKTCHEHTGQEKLVTREKLNGWKAKFSKMVDKDSRADPDIYAQDFSRRYHDQTNMVERCVATILAFRGNTNLGHTGL
jgi:hypothetical protein